MSENVIIRDRERFLMGEVTVTVGWDGEEPHTMTTRISKREGGLWSDFEDLVAGQARLAVEKARAAIEKGTPR